MMQEDEQHSDHRDQGLGGYTKVCEVHSVAHGEPMKNVSVNYERIILRHALNFFLIIYVYMIIFYHYSLLLQKGLPPISSNQ